MAVLVSVSLTEWTCGTCGILFAVPQNIIDERRTQGGGFFCPNGHERGWYGDNTTLAKLRAEVQKERQRADQADAGKREADAAAFRLREAIEEQNRSVRRLKKRVANGICPCCQRTFKDLSAHMANKHPGYGPSSDANVKQDEAKRKSSGKEVPRETAEVRMPTHRTPPSQ